MIQGPYKQNNLRELPNLPKYRYENLFNVYLKDGHYEYNILSKVNIPDNLDVSYYTTYIVPNNSMPYTLLSYKIYGTTLLWWLICATNKIVNPVYFPAAGTQLKILKPSVVSTVLKQL